MDPITQNQPAPAHPQGNPSEHKKFGPIVASLIVVLVLIFAALYLFAAKVSQHNAADNITDPTVSPTTTTSNSSTVQPVTNTSDDLQSIQNDLNDSTSGVDQQNF